MASPIQVHELNLISLCRLQVRFLVSTLNFSSRVSSLWVGQRKSMNWLSSPCVDFKSSPRVDTKMDYLSQISSPRVDSQVLVLSLSRVHECTLECSYRPQRGSTSRLTCVDYKSSPRVESRVLMSTSIRIHESTDNSLCRLWDKSSCRLKGKSSSRLWCFWVDSRKDSSSHLSTPRVKS